MNEAPQFQLETIRSTDFGRHLDYHAVIDSTNDEAKRRAAEPGCPLPLLVLAERQTAGRGRGGNRWWSAEGCLMFSLALGPDRLPDDRQHAALAALASALAVVDAVTPLLANLPLGIHWPNDVMVAERKLAGILIEVAAARRHVIGIGLNTNNLFADAPADVRRQATSLRELTGRTYDRTTLLVAVLTELEQRLAELYHAPVAIARQAHDRCLQRGRTLTVAVGQSRVVGQCVGIGDDGTLMLDTPDGRRSLASGSVCRE
jgi:BirA family biotin operon repressor/biotin-[acetyl-CoA-carboxylase] ligase